MPASPAPLVPVDWQGQAPSAPLQAAVRSAGATLDPAAGPPRARVVFTATARNVPSSTGALPWLWLCAARLPPDARREAVLRGAYEAISLAEGDTAQLSTRLSELLVAPPALPKAPFVSESPVARRLLESLALAARTSMPVLLTGETGTGKEVAARLIHSWSARGRGQFVPINCAAIPNEMMEGELFGYAKGAFSGAVRAYDGLMAAASGGTVFLDEIDDTPHSLQVKLLRVLEDRVVSRLGENLWRDVDFRLIAATNRDLRPLIAAGTFGADLYERLAIVSIQLPPLRERREDIPALVTHFMARFYQEEPAQGRGRVRDVSPDALAALEAFSWPGNIRELRNVIFGALVTKRAGTTLLLSDLPRRILEGKAQATSDPTATVDATRLDRLLETGTFNLRKEIEALERAALSSALARTSGNAAQAARLLGEVGRGTANDPGGTVRSMMRRLGIAFP